MRNLALAAAIQIGLVACDPLEVCTLVGCDDGVLVDFPGWPLDDGTYDLTVTGASGEVYACTVVVTESGTRLDSQRCSDPGAIVSVTLDRNGIGTLGVRTPVLGDEVAVEVSFDDAVVLSDSGPVDYEMVQPNGPDCEPTCTIGTARFPLP